MIKPQWINNFCSSIDWTKKTPANIRFTDKWERFYAFPPVIPADYMICITRSVLLHIIMHTQTHNISRKVLISAKAMAINTFTVSNLRVHPLNNESFLAAMRKEWTYSTSSWDFQTFYSKFKKQKWKITLI